MILLTCPSIANAMKKMTLGGRQGCISAVHWPCKCEALGVILSTKGGRKRERRNKGTFLIQRPKRKRIFWGP